MDFMRGTVRVINQLETNSRLNGKRGDDQRYKNCPKYKWKKVKNHSLFKRIYGVFHCKPDSESDACLSPTYNSSKIIPQIFPAAWDQIVQPVCTL